MASAQLAAVRLPTQHRSSRSCLRTPVVCRAHPQSASEGPSRRVLQLASLIGAASLALLPLSAPVQARPSDMIQSEAGEGKITKFPTNPSVSGNQARAPSDNATGPSTGKPNAADVRGASALDPNQGGADKKGSLSNLAD